MTSEIKSQIEKYLNYTIIVEGKRDLDSLKSLGFKKILILHYPNQSINNSIEKISSQVLKGEKVLILTDLDKKGKYFHSQLKSVFQQKGIKVDSSLRKILAKEGISHIEGLNKFLEKSDN